MRFLVPFPDLNHYQEVLYFLKINVKKCLVLNHYSALMFKDIL